MTVPSSPVVGWRERARTLGRSYQGDRVEPQAGRLAGYLLTALAALDAVEQERDASVEECRVLQVLLRQQTINHEERDAGWVNAERAEDRLELVEQERDALRGALVALRTMRKALPYEAVVTIEDALSVAVPEEGGEK